MKDLGGFIRPICGLVSWKDQGLGFLGSCGVFARIHRLRIDVFSCISLEGSIWRFGNWLLLWSPHQSITLQIIQQPLRGQESINLPWSFWPSSWLCPGLSGSPSRATPTLLPLFCLPGLPYCCSLSSLALLSRRPNHPTSPLSSWLLPWPFPGLPGTPPWAP